MLVGVKILVIRAITGRVNDSLLGKTYKYFPEACNITPAFDNNYSHRGVGDDVGKTYVMTHADE